MTESEKVDIATKALERLVKNPHVERLITEAVQDWLTANAKRMAERVIDEQLINGSIRSVARKVSERVEEQLTKLVAEGSAS